METTKTWQRDKGLNESAANDITEAIKNIREDIEAAKWVREHGGLELLKLHEYRFQRMMWERNEYRALARKYEHVMLDVVSQLNQYLSDME